MIVRLDLERDGDAVADVNDAGIFLARADEDLGRLGGEGFEQRLGVFVAAMLAPHHGKDAELGVARRATEDFHGVGVFFRREVVLGNQLWGNGGFGHGKIQFDKAASRHSAVLRSCKVLPKSEEANVVFRLGKIDLAIS